MISTGGRIAAVLAVMVAVALCGAPRAVAGTYVVHGCAGTAQPGWESLDDFFFQAWAGCPWGQAPAKAAGFSISTFAGIFSSGISGGWAFTAPPDTRVVAVSGHTASRPDLVRVAGETWYRGAWDPDTGTGIAEVAPTAGWQSFAASGFASYRVALGLRCLSSCVSRQYSGANWTPGEDWISFSDATVTVRDDVSPVLEVTQPLAAGWHGSERVPISFNASDNVGVATLFLYVDGVRIGFLDRGCYVPSSNDSPAPCSATGAPWTVVLDTSELTHGSHAVLIKAGDPAGNIAERAFSLLVDHNAPAAPRALRLASGSGWRRENRFDVAWSNPPDQSESAIAGAEYVLCPAASAPYDDSGCQTGRVSGDNLSEIRGLQLPGDGSWRLRLSLRDAVGNLDRDRVATLDDLHLDREAPTATFEPLDPSDPTRIRVTASDATSGMADVEIEARRRGETTWTTLGVDGAAGRYSAAIDDASMPDGRYELRARVTDQAGNERTVTTLPSGDALELQLPLRTVTSVAVGQSRRVRVKTARGKPVYRRVLVRRPQAGFGSTVALSGKLTDAAGNPVSGAPVEVLEHVDLPGLDWKRLATVKTVASGAFTFRAVAGPARTLRFRYPGSATTRPESEEVELRVRAGISLTPSRNRLRNGHSVMFRGRLLGAPVPEEGKLLALQALTTRGWRTFATPRARGRDGRWSYRYNFTDTSTTVRYSFRVVAPKEAGYPYEQGISKVARVLVLGTG
jgi:hypothetical protein